MAKKDSGFETMMSLIVKGGFIAIAAIIGVSRIELLIIILIVALICYGIYRLFK